MHAQQLIRIVGHPRRLQEASKRPRKATRAIEHPMIKGIPDTATHRPHVIDRLRNIVNCSRPRPRHVVSCQGIEKGHLGFDTKKPAGWQNVVVANLQAASETSEWVVYDRRTCTADRRVCSSPAIADVPANIGAAPIKVWSICRCC